MNASKFIHQDDGGTVTLFGGADKQMLFACTGGHYWIVKAAKMGSAADSALAGDGEADAELAADDRVEAIRRDFGDTAVSMMNL